MGKDDWFRNGSWTDNEKKNFFNRLNRSRTDFHKGQYLKIKAYYLLEENPEAALELCEMVLKNYPIPFLLNETYSLTAECYIKLGKFEETVQAFRNSMDAIRQYPNSTDHAHLTYGKWAISMDRTDLYDEILGLIYEFPNEGNPIPIIEYWTYGIRAIIYNYQKNTEQSRHCALKALENADNEYSGFRYHQTTGVVINEEKKSLFYKKILKIAKADNALSLERLKLIMYHLLKN